MTMGYQKILGIPLKRHFLLFEDFFGKNHGFSVKKILLRAIVTEKNFLEK
jgi:hypothetical protein